MELCHQGAKRTFMCAHHMARLAGSSTNASPQWFSSLLLDVLSDNVKSTVQLGNDLDLWDPLLSHLIPKRRECHGQKSCEALNISDFTPWDAPMSTNDVVQHLRKLLTLNAMTKHDKT